MASALVEKKSALLHGVCTVHTSEKAPSEIRVEGKFDVGTQDVQAATATFLAAMEPHSRGRTHPHVPGRAPWWQGETTQVGPHVAKPTLGGRAKTAHPTLFTAVDSSSGVQPMGARTRTG